MSYALINYVPTFAQGAMFGYPGQAPDWWASSQDQGKNQNDWLLYRGGAEVGMSSGLLLGALVGGLGVYLYMRNR